MTARELLRKMLAERRAYPAASMEYQWRTNAARKYVWMLRGVPTNKWKEMEARHAA
jgi:hypothetical protein